MPEEDKVDEPVAPVVEGKVDTTVSDNSLPLPVTVPSSDDSKRKDEGTPRRQEEVAPPIPDPDAPPLPEEEAPPLPEEEAPPLPDEAPPEDDGWEARFDDTHKAWYFYNRFTEQSQWENPRVPSATSLPAVPPAWGSGRHPDDSGTSMSAAFDYDEPKSKPGPAGGYNPAVHGDYDPNADYAKDGQEDEIDKDGMPKITDPSQIYATVGSFNRFTGKWQAGDINPENHNDAAKSKRQMQAFFDVDAAANSHDGRSLKEERRNKKLTKEQVKAYNDKRRAKKEEKRRAWLKD